MHTSRRHSIITVREVKAGMEGKRKTKDLSGRQHAEQNIRSDHILGRKTIKI